MLEKKKNVFLKKKIKEFPIYLRMGKQCKAANKQSHKIQEFLKLVRALMNHFCFRRWWLKIQSSGEMFYKT